MTQGQLAELNDRLATLLTDKVVGRVRLTERELFIEFKDGGRLFVDGQSDGRLELSVT